MVPVIRFDSYISDKLLFLKSQMSLVTFMDLRSKLNHLASVCRSNEQDQMKYKKPKFKKVKKSRKYNF